MNQLLLTHVTGEWRGGHLNEMLPGWRNKGTHVVYRRRATSRANTTLSPPGSLQRAKGMVFFYLSIVMSGTGQGKMLKNSERVKVVRISLEGG